MTTGDLVAESIQRHRELREAITELELAHPDLDLLTLDGWVPGEDVDLDSQMGKAVTAATRFLFASVALEHAR